MLIFVILYSSLGETQGKGLCYFFFLLLLFRVCFCCFFFNSSKFECLFDDVNISTVYRQCGRVQTLNEQTGGRVMWLLGWPSQGVFYPFYILFYFLNDTLFFYLSSNSRPAVTPLPCLHICVLYLHGFTFFWDHRQLYTLVFKMSELQFFIGFLSFCCLLFVIANSFACSLQGLPQF